MEPVVHDLSNKFHAKTLDEERDEKSVVISMRLNKDEMQKVQDAGRLMQQEMPSSIIKQLMELGLVCLQHEETRLALRIATENVRRNVRRGVVEAQPKIGRM